MRYLILILLFSFNCLSQQTVEICNDFKTFTYSSSTTSGNDIEWKVNGVYYYGNEITLTWNKAGIYEITATSMANGCYSFSQTYTVTVIECDILVYWVPNSFTPDDNEFNQTWGPVFSSGYPPDRFEVIILNRWGNIIFQSNDPKDRWDGMYKGKQCPDGVYTWLIVFGLPNTGEKKLIHGYVTIIR